MYNKNGSQVNSNVNISILDVADGKYKIKIDNTQGTVYSILDETGAELVAPNYTYIEYLFDDYFIACNNEGKLGVIDKKDNKKIELKYDSVQRIPNTNIIQTTILTEKLTEIYNHNIEKTGQMINANIDNKTEYIKMYNEEEVSYFNTNGEIIQNTQIYNKNQLFAKSQEGKWGFVDKDGRVVVDYNYEKVTEFNPYGYAGIKQNGKWGVMDQTGSIILEPIYEFSNNIEPSFISKYYKVSYGVGELYYTDEK